jgi:chromate transporter
MKEHGVPFGEAMKVWARVAALSFGGPAGQIAVMHRIIVEEKKWIGDNRFLQALNYCTLLPGPEAQQLAVYIGWLMHKTKGGLVAGILFVLRACLRSWRSAGSTCCWARSPWCRACSSGSRPRCW